MGLLSGLVTLATSIIGCLGYPGVLVLMALESMVVPVPSEAVMPFAGFLVTTGRFSSILLVTVVATVGSLIGSGLSYGIGALWGDGFVHRFGKWFLITPHDWEVTQRFFKRRGAWSVFLARFIPGVRHLISIPAGATRMDLRKFFVATLVGAFVWNGFLAFLGERLGADWERVGAALEPVEYVVVAVLAVLVVLYVVWHLRRLRKPMPSTRDGPESP